MDKYIVVNKSIAITELKELDIGAMLNLTLPSVLRAWERWE